MDREQIVKALECCSKDDCDNCPNTFGNCYSNLAKDALSLIKELTEELEVTLKQYTAYQEAATQRMRELTEENERLRAVADMSDTTLNDALRIVNEFCDNRIKRAVMKMQERLMAEERIFEAYGTRWKVIYSSAIDQIAKEIIGEAQ